MIAIIKLTVVSFQQLENNYFSFSSRHISSYQLSSCYELENSNFPSFNHQMQWLRLDKNDKLLIREEARTHLSKMPSKNALSVIAIFGNKHVFQKIMVMFLQTDVCCDPNAFFSGAARQGKSFLMNTIAGGNGCGFAVSNSQDPCTVGVDIANNTMSLKDFCGVNQNTSFINDKYVDAQLKKHANIKVGFIDVEGQGDRDAAYDARIATPVQKRNMTKIKNENKNLHSHITIIKLIINEHRYYW
jgi:hypothetical protein